ncbi:hypothetical protein ACQPZX_19245 [Actinoplanes sp. CA-142083]|uniref:hypothetical protein n=1 Tax=Actinoplanes sp. CA-142083 TaxID=3239903 RepID=UPI003D945816
MSLSSLRSFSGAASLATTAFDTARSTLKAMAEAAVPPGEAAETTGGERPDQGAAPAMMSAEPTVAKSEAAERTPTEKRKAGIRKGLALDAYA